MVQPIYDISIRDNGNTIIMRNSDFEVWSGNCNTDPAFRSKCLDLEMASHSRKYDKEPLFELKTKISSVTKNKDGSTTIEVPENPFLSSFNVGKTDFNFSAGHNVYYTASNPPEMLIGDPKGSTTIVKHPNMGWMDLWQYQYFELNEASRMMYDKLIDKADHHRLYDYLKDVEKLVETKDDSILADKSKEYQEKAHALASEYEKIIAKSIVQPDHEFMKADVVKDSPLAREPEKFVPSHLTSPYGDFSLGLGKGGRF